MNLIWDENKNDLLKKSRGISFEQVTVAILENQVLTILEHPNQNKYPTQKVIIINIDNYAYAVPFVKTENGDFFLKTIYPSGKYTNLYLRGNKDG